MAMVLVATFAWSFAGLFTRSLTIDVFTTIAWRSFAGGVLLLAIWLMRRRSWALRDLAALRQPDWAAVLANVVAQAAFSACLFLTSVAHVAVIYAFTPLIAALMAWWWLGDAIRPSTVLAILVSAAGVVTVVAGSFGTGTLLGDALALVMTAAFATMIVLPKAYPSLRVTESIIISAFITFALFLPFSRTMAVNSELVARLGPTSGSITLNRMSDSRAPSSSAASRRAGGGVVTLTVFTCQEHWSVVGSGEQIQYVNAPATKPKWPQKRLYWLNVTMPYDAGRAELRDRRA